MTTSRERKAVGDALEQRIAEELTLRGWRVNAWGQGVLNPSVRHALKNTDSSMRWTPDLIIARGETVAFVDCKGRMTSSDSNRHSIERAAVKAHLQLAAWADLPIYYVFDNLGVLNPHDVLTHGHVGPHSRVGSGAPYYLISTSHAEDFDQVFGKLAGSVQQTLKLVA